MQTKSWSQLDVTILAENIVCYRRTSTKLHGMLHDMF